MLLVIARKKLEEYIRNRNVPKADVKEPILLEKCGAVITLIKNSSLRECIGYIQPAVPLHKTISDMAIATSTKNSRFPAASQGELKVIRIEISFFYVP